jgi:acid phosphatase family membrane protein YuiD
MGHVVVNEPSAPVIDGVPSDHSAAIGTSTTSITQEWGQLSSEFRLRYR